MQTLPLWQDNIHSVFSYDHHYWRHMTVLTVLPDAINVFHLFFLCRLFRCKAESLLQDLSTVKFSEPLHFFPHSIFSLNANNDWGSRYLLWHSQMGGTADTLLKPLIREKFRWESRLYFGHRESWQAQGTFHRVRNEMAPHESCTEITSNQEQHTSGSNEWDTFSSSLH